MAIMGDWGSLGNQKMFPVASLVPWRVLGPLIEYCWFDGRSERFFCVGLPAVAHGRSNTTAKQLKSSIRPIAQIAET